MLSPPPVLPPSPEEGQGGFYPHPHACGVSVGLARQAPFALCPVAEGLSPGHEGRAGNEGTGLLQALRPPGRCCWMLSRGTVAKHQLTVAKSVPSCLRLLVSPCKPG